jgi:phytanoyl-CoA hydroxylase
MLRVPSMAKCAPSRQAIGMNTTQTAYELSKEQISFFRREGYLIVRGLFGADEVAALRGRFERLADDTEPAPKPQLWPVDRAATDPLQRYPRVMMPHHWDPLARQWLLDPRVGAILRTLLGDEPIAAQSMFYFKPPGARGQALHQDNFYLKVEPHTCIAAWTAIDPSTPENGGLKVVPRTQGFDLVCPELADSAESFSTQLVRPPAGMDPVPATLASGDTLFFNGNVIHGSEPNRSATQWRRSFICHYMPASARCISNWYFPLMDFAGGHVPYEANTGGGPCGIEFTKPNYGA